MEWFERGLQIAFQVLLGVVLVGVFAMLALEAAFRRWRDDRLAAREPPATALEAAYRERTRAPRRGPVLRGRHARAEAVN